MVEITLEDKVVDTASGEIPVACTITVEEKEEGVRVIYKERPRVSEHDHGSIPPGQDLYDTVFVRYNPRDLDGVIELTRVTSKHEHGFNYGIIGGEVTDANVNNSEVDVSSEMAREYFDVGLKQLRELENHVPGDIEYTEMLAVLERVYATPLQDIVWDSVAGENKLAIYRLDDGRLNLRLESQRNDGKNVHDYNVDVVYDPKDLGEIELTASSLAGLTLVLGSSSRLGFIDEFMVFDPGSQSTFYRIREGRVVESRGYGNYFDFSLAVDALGEAGQYVQEQYRREDLNYQGLMQELGRASNSCLEELAVSGDEELLGEGSPFGTGYGVPVAPDLSGFFIEIVDMPEGEE